MKTPDERIRRNNRRFFIETIIREFFGRYARTERSHIRPEFLSQIVWFTGLPKVRMELPNFYVKGGTMIERMQVNYALFALLMKNCHENEIRVVRGKQIAIDWDRGQIGEELYGVKYLMVVDTEGLKKHPLAIEALMTRRYQQGNSTILVGNELPVTEMVRPIMLKCFTMLNLSDGEESVTFDHADLPKERRYARPFINAEGSGVNEFNSRVAE